jgi:DNA-binding MarR family transcriptional regulator
LCFALYTASRAVVRAYGPILAPLGLTYPQYVTMIALWEADRPPTVGELGKRLHLETGTLTPLLKRLEQLGLISRTRDSRDERRVLVAVTAQGAALHRAACDVPGRIAERYAGAGPQSRAAALAKVAELRSQLDQLVGVLEFAEPPPV